MAVSSKVSDAARERQERNNALQAERIKERLERTIARAQPLIEATKKGEWRMGKGGWEIVDIQGNVLWSEATAPVGG